MKDNDYSALSLVDKEGRVFLKNNTFYRGVFSETSEILNFLKTPIFKELVKENFIPDSEIVNDKNEIFHAVIKHETSLHVTYPHEWSLDMLKDACLMYLKLYQKCLKNGYYLKDGHGYNIVFFNTTAKFVDLGSIQKGELKNLQEFNKTLFLPILIIKTMSLAAAT